MPASAVPAAAAAAPADEPAVVRTSVALYTSTAETYTSYSGGAERKDRLQRKIRVIRCHLQTKGHS